jgi:hypothetical protein
MDNISDYFLTHIHIHRYYYTDRAVHTDTKLYWHHNIHRKDCWLHLLWNRYVTSVFISNNSIENWNRGSGIYLKCYNNKSNNNNNNSNSNNLPKFCYRYQKFSNARQNKIIFRAFPRKTNNWNVLPVYLFTGP